MYTAIFGLWLGIIDSTGDHWLSVELDNKTFCHARPGWVVGDATEGSTVLVLRCE
jgi:hypothetical protein